MALLADHLTLHGWLAMPYLNIDLLKYNDHTKMIEFVNVIFSLSVYPL